MAQVIVRKNAIGGSVQSHEVDGCTLLDWIVSHEPGIADKSVCVKLNGVVIGNTVHHEDMDARCDFKLGAFDRVEILVAPEGVDPVSLAIFAVVAIAASFIAVKLMPSPKIPGDAGLGTSSPNNQLNAANNAFRPREATPNIAGEVISFPDFVQRPHYIYRANRREWIEVFCVGEGYHDLDQVKDGATLFDDLPLSTFEAYEPFEGVPDLYDVRTAEGATDLTLFGPNDDNNTANIQNGTVRVDPDRIHLGDSAQAIIQDFDLKAGDEVFLNINYTEIDGLFPAVRNFTGIVEITDVIDDEILINTAIAGEPTFRDSANGIIRSMEEPASPWFNLEGDQITTVRFHMAMPRGLRDENGDVARVDYNLEVQRVNASGQDVGDPIVEEYFFSAAQQDPLYVTRDIEVSSGRYKARAVRTTDGLDGNAADLLQLERLESVRRYSNPLVGVAEGITTNQMSWAGFTQEFIDDLELEIGTRVSLVVSSGDGGQNISVVREITDITEPTTDEFTLHFDYPTGGNDTGGNQAWITNRDVNRWVFGDFTVIKTFRVTQPMQGRGASEKINLRARRRLPLFDPISGQFDFTQYVHTRSFAQYVMYLLCIKGKIAIELVNYRALFDIEARLPDVLRAFDFTFDDKDVSLRERVTAACNVARVRHYNIGNYWEFIREEEQPVRSDLFNLRNMAPEGFTQQIQCTRTAEYDSIELEYVDPEKNSPAYVRRRIMPDNTIAPGLGDRVWDMRLGGCRNVVQATNRIEYEIRRLAYQHKTAELNALNDGMNIGPSMRIGVANPNHSKVFGGEILEQEFDVLTLSEKFLPEPSTDYYIYIRNEDGTTSNSVLCTAVPGEPFKVEAPGLSAFIADGVDSQLGSVYVIASNENQKASDWSVVSRGVLTDRGHVPIELANYDPRLFEMDDPVATPPTINIEPVNMFEPELWTVNGPRSASFAGIVEDNGDTIACYFTSRRKSDLVGLIWQTADPLPHRGLRYGTHRNIETLVVTFDITLEGAMADMDDVQRGLTMTVRTREAGEDVDYFVRMWRYVDDPNSDPRQAQVTLDFANLRAGFEGGENDVLVPTDNVVEIFFGLTTDGYTDSSDTDPMPENQNGVLKLRIMDVNRTINIAVPEVDEHPFRISTGFDDSYNFTPQRLVNNLHKLGYRGRVNHYCGMSHYYEQEWNEGEGRYHVKKTGTLLNRECRLWHEAFASTLADYNMSMIFSISYELFSEVCPFEWGQRDWDDNMGVTGYEPPSFLLSPCIEPAMEYLQNIFVEFAAIAESHAVDTWLQVGEPWWWFNTADARPCFYDFPTRTKFNDETGLFAPEFPTIHDTQLTGTPYDEFKAFLRKELGNSTLAIRDAVKAVYPTAQLAPLVFLPSILDESVGIITDVNYPEAEWQSPAWDFMQTEAYDWIIHDELTKAERAFTLPSQELGYQDADVHYLAGFVPDDFLGNIIMPGYDLERDGPGVWQRILNNMQTGFSMGVTNHYIWAQPQIDRDSVFLVAESVSPPVFGIWVNSRYFRAST